VLLTTEAVCVYSALKTDSLDTLPVNLSFQYSSVIAQAVCCRPFTTEARLPSVRVRFVLEEVTLEEVTLEK
jgi:hypothetical protein